jgi:hypothetical protein
MFWTALESQSYIDFSEVSIDYAFGSVTPLACGNRRATKSASQITGGVFFLAHFSAGS